MTPGEKAERSTDAAGRDPRGWLIAAELPSDLAAIRMLVIDAFGRPEEADLVDRLRSSDAWLPELALVARPSPGGAAVAGFARLTRMQVGGRSALAVAPVAVAPGWQGRGAGSALVRTGIARAIECGERLIVVLSDPRYYGRFGFVAAGPLGNHGPYASAGPAFQALSLAGTGTMPVGLAIYPDEFEGL